MTLAGYMAEQFSTAQNIDFLMRLLVACLCGAVIGYERSLRFKEAGIRTHIIVCCAASLMMIVSKYSFADLTSATGVNFNGTRGADPARIAAQVVSGVSFLGAGVIFRNGTSIKGLTTAAGIWVTAGIGLAVGAGMYLVGIMATIVVALIQILMHKFVVSSDTLTVGQIHFTVRRSDEFIREVYQYIEKNAIQVLSTKISYNDNGDATYDMTLKMNENISAKDLSGFFESHEGVHEVRFELGS